MPTVATFAPTVAPGMERGKRCRFLVELIDSISLQNGHFCRRHSSVEQFYDCSHNFFILVCASVLGIAPSPTHLSMFVSRTAETHRDMPHCCHYVQVVCSAHTARSTMPGYARHAGLLVHSILRGGSCHVQMLAQSTATRRHVNAAREVFDAV
jgi:hypothetical protein